MDLIFNLIACHFIGDFALQSNFLANNKGKSWEINFYHAITYTSTFILFSDISLTFYSLIFFSHLIIDPLKAKYGIIKTIYTDQILHIVILVIGYYFFV
ncbi:MAG: DUF3307 domain-containing protein [Candidatus Moranbacteria bacterium]|nr:DUF3307 domain-containing protein [Candidatus Moranbacteria bacterium]